MPNGIPAAVMEASKAADAAIEEAVREQENGGGDTPVNLAPTPAPSRPVNQPGHGVNENVEILRQEVQSLREQVELERRRADSAVGRMASEGPQQAERIRGQSEEIDRLRAEIQRIGASGGPAGDPAGYQTHLTPEEREEYKTAKDALGLQGRAILGVLERQLVEMQRKLDASTAESRTKLDALRGNSMQEAAKNHDREVWEAVDRIQEGAFNANFNDPGFAQWIRQIEPNSGLTWQEIAQRAFTSTPPNVQRLAEIVKRYLAVSGTVRIPSTEGMLPRVRPTTVRGRPGSLSDSAAPGSSAEIIKASDYNRFCEEITKGLWNGADRVAERDRLLAVYDKALGENRIDHTA